MRAFVFPGQASQFPGMGKKLYTDNPSVRPYFDLADEMMGFSLSNIMFEGTEEELRQTLVTQPSVFLFSYVSYKSMGEDAKPEAVAGHSLGEFTALVANECISFEDGLRLVKVRATAMQKACEAAPGTMSAIVGMTNKEVEQVCEQIDGVVIAANYNCPGQIVISGSIEGVEQAELKLREVGAKRVIRLAVGGAFHSPLMATAASDLDKAIQQCKFNTPICPIYQNVSGTVEKDPVRIQELLLQQLTSPVRWTQTMEQMMADGVTEIIECGGKVLSGFFKKLDRKFPTRSVM